MESWEIVMFIFASFSSWRVYQRRASMNSALFVRFCWRNTRQKLRIGGWKIHKMTLEFGNPSFSTHTILATHQVVAHTRWIVPQANIVPTKQKQISGNNLAWKLSPNTIVSRFEMACEELSSNTFVEKLFNLFTANIYIQFIHYRQRKYEQPGADISAKNGVPLCWCKPWTIQLHSWKKHHSKNRWQHQRDRSWNRWKQTRKSFLRQQST